MSELKCRTCQLWQEAATMCTRTNVRTVATDWCYFWEAHGEGHPPMPQHTINVPALLAQWRAMANNADNVDLAHLDPGVHFVPGHAMRDARWVFGAPAEGLPFGTYATEKDARTAHATWQTVLQYAATRLRANAHESVDGQAALDLPLPPTIPPIPMSAKLAHARGERLGVEQMRTVALSKINECIDRAAKQQLGGFVTAFRSLYDSIKNIDPLSGLGQAKQEFMVMATENTRPREIPAQGRAYNKIPPLRDATPKHAHTTTSAIADAIDRRLRAMESEQRGDDTFEGASCVRMDAEHVALRYADSCGPSYMIKKYEAQIYLDWLIEGNIGTHLAARAAKMASVAACDGVG